MKVVRQVWLRFLLQSLFSLLYIIPGIAIQNCNTRLDKIPAPIVVLPWDCQTKDNGQYLVKRVSLGKNCIGAKYKSQEFIEYSYIGTVIANASSNASLKRIPVHVIVFYFDCQTKANGQFLVK